MQNEAAVHGFWNVLADVLRALLEYSHNVNSVEYLWTVVKRAEFFEMRSDGIDINSWHGRLPRTCSSSGQQDLC